jgi:hypothetical protein
MANCGNVFCDASPRKETLSLKHLDTAEKKNTGNSEDKYRKNIKCQHTDAD